MSAILFRTSCIFLVKCRKRKGASSVYSIPVLCVGPIWAFMSVLLFFLHVFLNTKQNPNSRYFTILLHPISSLQWHNNKFDGVSNHHCLPASRLLRRRSKASLASVRGIHRGSVNSQHKGPVARKMFPIDDVIMYSRRFDVSQFAKEGELYMESSTNIYSRFRYISNYLQICLLDSEISDWILDTYNSIINIAI